MKPTEQLYLKGQSLWLDNITRDLLTQGTLEFRAAGVDLETLARKLQDDGAASFVASWNDLLKVINGKVQSFADRPRATASNA